MKRHYRVGKSKIHGKGVFATVDIKKGQSVCALSGTLVHRKIRNAKESLRFVNWIEIGPDTWVNPNKTAARHFNHSCDPNTVVTASRTLKAIKPIKAGEEITFDYSLTDTDALWYVTCNCHSPHCRKIIGSVHTLSKNVFRKKIHHIPRYARIAFDTLQTHEAVLHR